jgi:dipeptidyl aminopeptidase/acylaminoacyl peptidase
MIRKVYGRGVPATHASRGVLAGSGAPAALAENAATAAPARSSRVSVSRSALILAVLLLPGTAEARQPAVRDFFSAPFVSEITVSPGGGRVAWVVNAEGVRNIFVASPPEFRARQLTAHTRDDGQEIGSIAWSPDGATLFYVRGAGANRAGENPNAASDPAGAEQALWRIPFDGGAPLRIGTGSGPIVSPRGDVLLFQRGGAVWRLALAPAAADGAPQPEQLLRARGSTGSVRFSPDGGRIAFISNRGTHSFLGVYDLGTGTLRWIAPSTDRDRDPVWSPDGRSIAWIRVPANTASGLFRAVREGQPWSIHAADATTGAVRTVWTADAGSGSVIWNTVAENQLHWTTDDRIVFPWEKTGWLSLWSVPARGGPAVQLTPGAFEVEYVTLARDGRTVLYNSNQGDIDRRHLWRVPAAGGTPPVAITRGASVEWAPAELSDGHGIVALRSTASRPSYPILLAAGSGGAPAAGNPARELHPGLLPAGFPERAHVTPQAVTITAADGMQIPAQLFLPGDLRPGERRPATVFFHGGSRRQMLLGYHYGGYYHDTYAFNQWLASQGYIVLSVNFRSGIGYGRDFREALNYGAGGASEFNDVLGAGLYLRARPDVDPARIGIWGGSYGGYLTAMGLSRASDLFAAGVDIHGVHDWNVGIRTFVPTYNPLEDPAASALAFRSSPTASLDGWRSPVLVIHGDDDRNVSFIETIALVEALRARGVHTEQLVFPDEVHSFLLYSNRIATYEAAGDFFARMLRRR